MGLTSCISSSVTHTFAQVAHSDATMPSPMKMTYFDGRGRGEILRLILAKGGKKYEDVRITFDQWPDLKPQTPFGGLPMLEFNGKKFGQGLALALYLARENGLYGANNLENLMIDQILMCREDILVPEAKVKFEKDEKARADLLKGLVDATYPKFLGFFNNVIKENPAKSGFAVGKKISLADLIIFDVTQWISDMKPEVMAPYAELKACNAKVAATPGIKEYLATRKVTPF